MMQPSPVAAAVGGHQQQQQPPQRPRAIVVAPLPPSQQPIQQQQQPTHSGFGRHFIRAIPPPAPQRLHTSPPPPAVVAQPPSQQLLQPTPLPTPSQQQQQPRPIVVKQQQFQPMQQSAAAVRRSASPPTCAHAAAAVVPPQTVAAIAEAAPQKKQPQQQQQQQQQFGSIEDQFLERLQTELRQKDGAVTNLRERLAQTQSQAEAVRSELQAQVVQLQRKLEEDAKRFAEKHASALQGFEAQAKFKDKELLDLRTQLEDARAEAAAAAAAAQQSKRVLAQQSATTTATAAAATAADAKAPMAKRARRSSSLSIGNGTAAVIAREEYFAQQSARVRMCRKLLQAGLLLLLPSDSAAPATALRAQTAAVSTAAAIPSVVAPVAANNGGHSSAGTGGSGGGRRKRQSTALDGIVKCVLDGSVSCGALLPILDSAVAARQQQQQQRGKQQQQQQQLCSMVDVETMKPVLATLEVLMSSCPRCKAAVVSCCLCSSADLQPTSTAVTAAIAPAQHQRLPAAAPDQRVRLSGAVMQTPQAEIARAEQQRRLATREDAHPQQTRLLLRIVDECDALLMASDQLAGSALRIFLCAMDACCCAASAPASVTSAAAFSTTTTSSSSSSSAAGAIARFEPLVASGALRSVLAAERKVSAQTREAAIDVAIHFLRACKPFALAALLKDDQPTSTTTADCIAGILLLRKNGNGRRSIKPAAAKEDLIIGVDDEEAETATRRLWMKAVSFFMLAIAMRNGVGGCGDAQVHGAGASATPSPMQQQQATEIVREMSFRLDPLFQNALELLDCELERAFACPRRSQRRGSSGGSGFDVVMCTADLLCNLMSADDCPSFEPAQCTGIFAKLLRLATVEQDPDLQLRADRFSGFLMYSQSQTQPSQIQHNNAFS